jgi:predicted RNA-binding Zn-ribbon protein involved in translation (DUF1610 family)
MLKCLFATHLTVLSYNMENEVSLICHQCGKTFTRRSTLGQHERRHSNEGSYKCDECGSVAFSKANYLRHQQTHQKYDPRDFECSRCAKFFTAKDLKRHQMRKAGNLAFNILLGQEPRTVIHVKSAKVSDVTVWKGYPWAFQKGIACMYRPWLSPSNFHICAGTHKSWMSILDFRFVHTIGYTYL